LLGFVDAFIAYRLSSKIKGRRQPYAGILPAAYAGYYCKNEQAVPPWDTSIAAEEGVWKYVDDSLKVAVEVKIIQVSVGEILRQINLYKTFSRFDAWVLATRFTLTEGELGVLRKHHIRHVLLGEKFSAWKEKQESSEAQMHEL